MTESQTLSLTEKDKQLRQYTAKAFRIFVINCIMSSVGVTLATTFDALIVGNKYGERGLAITSVIMPMYMLYNLISFAIGIGGSLSVAKSLGKEDTESAKKTFSQCIQAGFIIGLVITMLGGIFIKPFVSLLGGASLGSGCEYYVLTIVLAAPLFIVSPILGLMLRTDANPRLATLGVSVAAVLNTLLDILFVLVLDIGVFGAALAMVIGQAGAVGVYCIHFSRKTALLKPKLCRVAPKQLLRLAFNGISTASTFAWQCLYLIIFNNVLAAVSGETGIAIFNLIFNVGMIAYAIFDGISQSIPPLIGTYAGERDSESIRITARLALRCTVICGAVLALLFFIFPGQIVNLFGITEEAAFEQSVLSVRIYAAAVLFVCLNNVTASYYQSIGKNKLVTVLNCLRSCVLLLGLGIPLAYNIGALGISVAILIAEIITFAIMLITVSIKKRKGSYKDILLINEKTNKNIPVFETVLQRDMETLDTLIDEINAFCEETEIDPKSAYFINLTIEEVAANIAKFGFTDKKNHYIAVKVAKYDTDIYVRIRDDAIGYNPFEGKKEESDDMDFLGIDVVKKKAKVFSYQRRLVFNNLLIIL